MSAAPPVLPAFPALPAPILAALPPSTKEVKHRHKWNAEEVRDVYRICRDNADSKTALLRLRERFPNENEYSDGALTLVRLKYEKRNNGANLIPFIPGEQTAAFGAQGKLYDAVWAEQDWRRAEAVAAEPLLAPPAAEPAVAAAPLHAMAVGGDVAQLLVHIRALTERLQIAENLAREARARELNLLIFLKKAQISHIRFLPYLFNIAHYEAELRMLEEELAML